jgi:NAD(P)-dependent dehydrogenase (short-subunit alcohol dehydrogenase family)
LGKSHILDGIFLGCKHAIKSMHSKGSGSIINISSPSGLIGIPTAAAYASSKAAVCNYTKSAPADEVITSQKGVTQVPAARLHALGESTLRVKPAWT